jgi:adenylate cyclase
VFPIPVIARGAAGFGLANAVLDGDGIVRRYPLAMRFRGKYTPSLALAVARAVRGDAAVESWAREALRKRTFVDGEGNLLLNWYGKGDVDGVFSYYSYRGVMSASIREETTGKPDSLRVMLKDKIVLIGSNAPGLLDNKSTPVSTGSAYPGMEVHATAIENFLADEFLSTVPRWIVLLVMTAVSVLLFVIIKTMKNLRLFMAAYFAFMAVEFAASWLLMLRDIWLPSVGIYLVTTLVFVGLVTSGYFTETREKRLLRRYFERYVNDSVLEEILANPTAVDFKGRTIQATVMATDIKDFTSISENMPAYDVVARLNGYLSEVSEVLINHGAFINKYIGDAILALYGSFGENPAHREQACRAALAAAAVISRMAEEAEAEGKKPFITRFGLNTGEMTIGNIGSARKIEFTVIGDAVNSAFRLEGINKYYGTRLLVSEFTREGAGDGFEFRLVDVLQLKGKDISVRIYELLGEKGGVDTAVLRRRDAYEKAFGLYTEKRFEEARSEFARLCEEGDGPSEVLGDRCRQFIEEPPAEDWNGVWRMFTK